MPLPQDLKTAYETFTLLALKHGYLYAALMIGCDPVDPVVIGNVTERGHALANLLRMHADYIDKQTAAGNVADGEPPINAN
jgi:hypothetical protein